MHPRNILNNLMKKVSFSALLEKENRLLELGSVMNFTLMNHIFLSESADKSTGSATEPLRGIENTVNRMIVSLQNIFTVLRLDMSVCIKHCC